MHLLLVPLAEALVLSRCREPYPKQVRLFRADGRRAPLPDSVFNSTAPPSLRPRSRHGRLALGRYLRAVHHRTSASPFPRQAPVAGTPSTAAPRTPLLASQSRSEHYVWPEGGLKSGATLAQAEVKVLFGRYVQIHSDLQREESLA